MIKIGDFAKMFDVSIKTVRFYEQKKLLKPAYVDVYTGYRYYDEENIKQMSTILVYKSLGFELNEIRNVQNDLILKKIDEYTNRIKTMYVQIDAMKSLLNNGERGISQMKVFVNDDKAIGKWSLIGLAESKEDFNNNKLLDDDISIKELYLMENGKEYWVVSWSKDYIYIKNKAYKYEIIGNRMFVTLTGLYSDESKIAVYEKVDDKHYTIEEIMHSDDTSKEFVYDENIVGLWNCVGTVKDKDFNISDIDNNGIIIKNLSVFPNGDVSIMFNSNVTKKLSYTKGFIKDFGSENVMSAYEIKHIDSKDYLVVEWKSGDYIFGGFISCYYVFEKINA